MGTGLCGAQRTGKTTLAKAYAEQTGTAFLQTSTSAVMKARGFDPAKDYPIAERLGIQKVILDALEAGYRAAPLEFITDRTPLDAAAYMLADVTRENVPAALQREITGYVERCIEITNRHFGILLVVNPGIELVAEEGKAPAEPAYMEHMAMLVNGLVNDERITARHYYVPRRVVDLDARVGATKRAFAKVIERTQLEALEQGAFH